MAENEIEGEPRDYDYGGEFSAKLGTLSATLSGGPTE